MRSEEKSLYERVRLGTCQLLCCLKSRSMQLQNILFQVCQGIHRSGTDSLAMHLAKLLLFWGLTLFHP